MQELYPGIYQVTITLKGFSPGSVNLYILQGPDGLTLIDTGWDLPPARESLQAQLSESGFNFPDIRQVLITHAHSDHLGMLNRLKRENGAAVYLHQAELELIRMRYTPRNDYWEQTDRFLYTHGLPPSEVPSLGYPLPDITELVEPDVWLQGGEHIPAGNYVLQVINTPGHSPGHVAYYEPVHRLIFSGDTLLPTVVTNAATHIQIMPNPLDCYRASLERLAALDIAAVLPGHEHPFGDHRRRIQELIAHQQARSDAVQAIFQRNPGIRNAYQVASQIAWSPKTRSITWDQLSTWDKRLAMMQSVAHLEYLTFKHILIRLSQSGKIEYQGPLESGGD